MPRLIDSVRPIVGRAMNGTPAGALQLGHANGNAIGDGVSDMGRLDSMFEDIRGRQPGRSHPHRNVLIGKRIPGFIPPRAKRYGRDDYSRAVDLATAQSST